MAIGGYWKLGRSRRAVAAAAVLATLTGFASEMTVASSSASAATQPAGVSPVIQRPASNVTADALPTVQIDGVVWSEAIVGNTVYAAGNFANARPAGAAPGTNLTPRANLLSFDITTGNLITSFAPSLNAQAKFVTASPDGSRIYVGGAFTTANGVTRNRIAAYSTSTGALITTFAPSLDATVNAITATNTTVYVAGNFGSANGSTRTHFAAFNASNGSLLPWAPTSDVPSSGVGVQALLLTPDGSKVLAGGGFTVINGSPAYGLGAIDATTGTLVPYAANQTVRDAGANAAILSLSTDGTAVYSSGYTYGGSGNFEGVMSSNPVSGAINWLADCHGDSYGASSSGNGIVYTVTHFHDCQNMGGFPDTNPRSVWHRTTAFTASATGSALANVEAGYSSFQGQPTPSLIDWMPDLQAGTFTGDSQAAWSVAATNNYVVEGGEFPSVNNTAQQGLVRFAVPSLATKKQGPVLYGAALTPTVTARSSTSARITWPSNWDRDDQTLTYTVRRADKGSTPIYTVNSDSQSWNLPQQGWIDTSLSPNTTYSYTVRATDQNGNAQGSSAVSVTTPAAAAPDSKYVQDVMAAGPTDYWRLDQAAGATANLDYGGFNDLTLGSGIAGGTAGAIAGDSDTASTFNGTSAGFGVTAKAIAAPETFTESAWFSTTSTTGGKIVGFGDKSSGLSTNFDRHIYMDTTGHVYFGVYNANPYTIKSPAAYNDGKYHQVVATMSSAGLALFIDGQLIGTNASTTVAQANFGYWRIGGDLSWSGANFFTGTIDDVAIYPTVLTLAQIRQQYTDSGRSAPVTSKPVASFTVSGGVGSAAVDASGSTDTGGTITSYSWNFGDNSVASSGVTSFHGYALAGTYTITLTVTDNQGATASTTRTVNIAKINVAPVASFTAAATGLTVTVDASGSSDSDGSITAYGWDFGDGTTGSGITATHTFATAGTYTITLSVTDNRAATTPARKSVTVAVNKPPVAAFTATPTNLSVALNGTGSSDADGTIAGYTWVFGDGTTGSGLSPTHVFAAAGTYAVILTVTDNQGATASTSRSLLVVTAGTTIASDAFNRTAAASWGTADVGGAWTLTGAASAFSANGASATMNLAAPGAVCVASLTSVSAKDFNAVVDTTINTPATGNGVFLTLIGRKVGTSDYALKERFLPGGVVHLVLSKVINGVETIFSEVNVAGLTYNPGDVTRVRFQITTSGTTSTLRGKVWKVGTPEPTAAQITQNDGDTTLQTAGSFAIQSWLSGSSTNAPTVATYDNLLVTTS